MDDNRREGTVKWFSRVKGYGFIAPDDEEKEIFVHFTGIEGEGYRNLEKGQRVSFVVEDTDKGPQAVAVRDQGFEATSWTAEPTDEPMGMMDMGSHNNAKSDDDGNGGDHDGTGGDDDGNGGDDDGDGGDDDDFDDFDDDDDYGDDDEDDEPPDLVA